ncbi:class I SAM-dependent methyltransferase [Dictyobacter aurantiacus]|uniref:Methyltransferase n=1 Tax=Dictyobacter aurantiacus TaxID=1936993 RepID=A0A401ZKQ5_9CHLR|nr:class I SAM-dependent methyltransferase [Dictyobacter aurantiacus]GCE07400.1 methyltransferase [Dictyobacter aurantiacus]
MKTYDDIAEWYDQWIGTSAMGDDPIFAEVAALMGDVSGRRICDLACGQGRVARYLAQSGARVVGVDLSAKLLAIARRHEEADPRGIEYVQADARQLDEPLAGTFDGVLCFMALMDIQDLAPTFHGVTRILRPGGWFVFSILHPCYHTSRSGEMETAEGTVRTIGRYFEEGHWRSDTRPGPPGRVGSYHRTLSTYLNTLTAAGLQLVRLSEPQLSPSNTNRAVWSDVPSILIVSSRKP